MRFSVIIPAHNAEEYICKALDSVMEQSFKDYEVVVVCDKCTDRTAELVQSYGIKPTICNHGRAGLSRNEGLDRARGEYILFLDSDDNYLHSEVFAMLDRALELSGADILQCGFVFGIHGCVKSRMQQGDYWPNVWSKAWKMSAIGNTRFTDMKIGEDLEFTETMLKKQLAFYEWDMPIVYYNYPREGSLMYEQEGRQNGSDR